jgi:membrane-associated protease RseP (regulator of RpoE activity)
MLVAAVVALGLFAGWPVLLMVGAIVVSVFLHELGHYLVAKWMGMKVTEFFIGFGPRIWSFRRGETEYGLKVIPAGAYVRIIGMHTLEEVDPADEARTYRDKPMAKRLPVVLAGPAMNLLIGFSLLIVIFAGFGVPQPDQWQVRKVLDGSGAAAAGVQVGDRILEVGGQPVGEFSDLAGAVRPNAGSEVEVVVERDGQRIPLTATLGWELSAAGAAALPGLDVGDQVTRVGDTEIATYQELTEALAEAPAGPVRLTFTRDDFDYTAVVTAPVELPEDGVRGLLGVSPQTPRVRENVVAATGEAASTFGEVTVMSVQGLGRFFSPDGLSRYAQLFSADSSTDPSASSSVTPLDPNAPTAPAATTASAGEEDRVLSILGVIRLGSQAADGAGAVTFLFLLVTVNIFLGLINLVPLLPFDGGHAAVAIYEGIRSRIAHRPYRVNMAKLMPLTYIVVFLMVGLGLSSMYLDIVNPAQNPFTP